MSNRFQPAPSATQLTVEPRRHFLRAAGSSLAGLAAAAVPGHAAVAAAADTSPVPFSRISAPSERAENGKPQPLAPDQRIGFAIVGLGRLAVEELLPAFGASRLARPTALVSGDRAKALALAARYGIDERSVYDYAGFDRIADNPAVQVVYIVLPNALHAEFTVRAARAGKHVLCEKPMSNTVAEAQQMIEACRSAGKKLMVAYRSQYEPMDRLIVKWAREGRLGALREFTAFNGQNQGDPSQWRLKKALAGGGSLPDIGLYCLNAARFMSGEEPAEVFGHVFSTPGDARFREVEETCHFTLRFPSGLVAQCGSSYSTHESKFLRLSGALGWAELNPAFSYTGIKLRLGTVAEGKNIVTEPAVDHGNQFTHEIDHMARCVAEGIEPHSGGAEGLQDMRIMEAIYRSAASGRSVRMEPPAQPTRGPEPNPIDVS